MEMVSFKVENGESEKITQNAYAHGMNKSEYIRFLVEKEREKMKNEKDYCFCPYDFCYGNYYDVLPQTL